MSPGRMQAFSDGVIAILITIMVLDLRRPDGHEWSDLWAVVPVLLAYVLSFAYLGVYWNNHHHMLALVHRVTGAVLWANLHLLFWLSLVPFTGDWMSESDFASVPTAVYAINLLGAGVAYYVLQHLLVRSEGPGSPLAQALGRDLKGRASVVLYVAAIVGALVVSRWVAVTIFVVVAMMWLVPDRRVERLARREPAATE